MAMKPQDFKDSQDIINSIKLGTVGRRDLVALMIYVREHLPNDMIRDIAHCVAHSDRDRGYVYSHIETFVSNLINIAKNGGILEVKPVFPRNELISKLHDDLKAIGFDVTRADIERNYAVVVSCLRDILSDTSMLLRHPNVKSCHFKEALIDGKPALAFVVYMQGLASGGALKIPENVGMGFPIF
jgi:hypothetical protein